MLYNNIMLQSYGTLARVYDSTGTPAMPSTHSTAPYTTAASVPYTITGPAMVNILAPVPSTRPSALNSMAALTTALAKPVMGTSDPAPAFAASFWYQPSVVSTAESTIRLQLVRVPARSASTPMAR